MSESDGGLTGREPISQSVSESERQATGIHYPDPPLLLRLDQRQYPSRHPLLIAAGVTPPAVGRGLGGGGLRRACACVSPA